MYDLKLAEFHASLPEDKQTAFQSLIDEGKLVTQVALQTVVDTAAQSLDSGVVLRWDS